MKSDTSRDQTIEPPRVQEASHVRQDARPRGGAPSTELICRSETLTSLISHSAFARHTCRSSLLMGPHSYPNIDFATPDCFLFWTLRPTLRHPSHYLRSLSPVRFALICQSNPSFPGHGWTILPRWAPWTALKSLSSPLLSRSPS